MAALQVADHAAAWGRRGEAVAPTEEAVTHYRALAEQNPAYLPDLAGALNNLGIRYGEVGRRGEAVAPTEEAVTLRRALAEQNPGYLPNLATALNNLVRRCADVGDGDRAEQVWQNVLDGLPGSAAATLLFYRAVDATAGDPRAAVWLHAVELSGQRELVAAARENAREHWRADPAGWAQAWTAASGAPPPPWLNVDPDGLAVAEAWIDTPTYQAEHDHLAQHPELLDPVFDVAVGEVLLRLPEDAADRYHRLRAEARSVGMSAAYRPLLLAGLASEFAAAAPARQQQLLADRRGDLLDDIVLENLALAAGQQDSDGSAEVALALLSLAGTGQDGHLAATFDALSDPDRFPALLDSTARAADAAALWEVALLAVYTARTEADAANAGLYLAIAAAIAEDDSAPELLREACAIHAEQRRAWIGRLADVGAVHPAVLRLITVLTEMDRDDQ